MANGAPRVGIDIGSQMMKVAQVASGRGGVSVTALGMAPTPPGTVENGMVVDPQQLGAALKRLLKESGVTVKDSVSSVSGQGALVVRVIEVPKMSDSELAETMRYEVERHVPFAANEVIMDYQPILRPDAPPDAPNMEVLLAVAQQDMIDRHVQMLLAAGLKPKAIDVEPLAANRCLVELGPNPYGERTVVIVNIGASSTDIGVFRNGILAFPRVLPMAGDMMTHNIAQQLGVSPEQAEELKRKFGEVILDQVGQPQAPAQEEGFLDFSLPTPTAAPPPPDRMPFDFSDPSDTAPTGMEEPAPAPAFEANIASESSAPATEHDPQKVAVFNAIAPVLSELLTELRRSVEYYRGRSADGRIDEILLCGGSANLKNLDQLLQSDLGIPTRVADPFQLASLASRNFSPEYAREVGPSFVVAVGLAAREMVQAPAPAAAGGKRGKK
jgi:type IV pilus assembly protein PilM